MQKIDMTKLGSNLPELEAALVFNLCIKQLESMDEKEFEEWLKENSKGTEIRLEKAKLSFYDENYKKAVLHYIAAWYYCNHIETS